MEYLEISIHAPREGSDGTNGRSDPMQYISIHAPREGSDGSPQAAQAGSPVFLSTLPARGATTFAPNALQSSQFLSTLPARGATDASFRLYGRLRISIHAPREGSDCTPVYVSAIASPYFYPRSPRGERQSRVYACMASRVISIHAPREGSDTSTPLAPQ